MYAIISKHSSLRRALTFAAVATTWACGAAPEPQGEFEANLVGRGGVWCLPGIDDDGDGQTDRHDLSLGLVRANSARECRGRLGGALWGSVPHPAGKFALSLSSGGGSEREVGVPSGAQQAADASGIPGRTYRKDPQPDGGKGYDCDDFAGDMEKHLTQEGFNATFTLIVYYDETGTATGAHAITDIHPAGGGTAWIEPQTGKPVTLDQDSDGQVGTGNAYDGPTEGNTGVEIFDSYEEAAMKYKMD